MKFAAILVLIATIFTAATSNATTYTIKFGGAAGNNYNPKTLEAMTGDTIVWEGSFQFHPLKYDVIPNGADTFACTTGTSFMYVLNVAGDYSYYCTVHGQPGGIGMAGTITVAVNSVNTGTSKSQAIMNPVVPNPANEMVMLSFDFTNATPITVTISSIDGKVVAAPVEAMPMGDGQQMVHIATSSLPNGTYIATAKGDGLALAQKFVVSR